MQKTTAPNERSRDILGKAIRSGNLRRYLPDDPSTHPEFDHRIHQLTWREIGELQEQIRTYCEDVLRDIEVAKVRRRVAPPRTLAKQEARKQVRLSKRDLYVLHHLDRDLEEIIEMRAYQAVAKKIAEFELTEKDLENFVPKGYSLLHSLFSTFCAQWTPIEQENN